MAKPERSALVTHIDRQRVAEIERGFRDFSASARRLATTRSKSEAYKDQWVAVYKGRIEAVAKSLPELNCQIQEKQIPASETLVRFLGRQEMTLIL